MPIIFLKLFAASAILVDGGPLALYCLSCRPKARLLGGHLKCGPKARLRGARYLGEKGPVGPFLNVFCICSFSEGWPARLLGGDLKCGPKARLLGGHLKCQPKARLWGPCYLGEKRARRALFKHFTASAPLVEGGPLALCC